MKTLLTALALTAMFGAPAAMAHPQLDKEAIAVDSPYPEVTALLNFTEGMIAKSGNELQGKTPDGRACTLAFSNHTWNGYVMCEGNTFIEYRRQGYISLNTDDRRWLNLGKHTSIGFWINPGCTYQGRYEVQQMDVTPQKVEVAVAATEQVDVLNKLTINLDDKGNVVSAEGTSSLYPASKCLFR
jgi:hypothetical protein